MNFDQLIAAIETTHRSMQKRAVQSVNISLTLRNWLIGLYIIEFEQHGQDRAHYGDKLLETIAKRLKDRKLKGLSVANLGFHRQFYLSYPQIRQTVSREFQSIFQ